MDIQHQLLASVPRWLHAKSSKRISHFVWQTQNLSFCDKRNNYSKQQKNQRMHSRSTRSRKCLLGSGLPGAFSQQWRHSAAATQERLRKCRGRQGDDKGIAITHSPRKPIVSSSRRNAIARNSAQSLSRTIVVPLHVHVLARGWPSPKAGVSA